jgi:HSP20 family protein
MRRFAEQMDRAFGNWDFDTASDSRAVWMPAIDVSERDGKIVVRADLPGKVEATDDALIIQGERRQEHEEQDRGYQRSERRYGSFYRTIPLPEGSQTEHAHAEFRNGVLEVSLPAPASQKRRREIAIEADGSSERKPAGSEAAAGNRTPKTG